MGMKIPRPRLNISGFGGISMSRAPSHYEGVESRKRRGKPDMTRREYYGGY